MYYYGCIKSTSSAADIKISAFSKEIEEFDFFEGAMDVEENQRHVEDQQQDQIIDD